MMSILIKGMEMPRNCWECGFCKTTTLEVDFCVLSRKQYNWGLEERPSDCPLVPVPPHGRLIDADELIEKQKEDAEIFMGSTNYGDKVRYDEAMNAVANIVNAPTVIPADKDGET